MRYSILLLAAALPAAPTLAAQQRPDTVRLTFAWPAELRASVHVSTTASVSGMPGGFAPEGPASSTVESVLRVRPHAEGLLVSLDSARVSGQAGMASLGIPAAEVHGAAGEMRYVVSRNGTFIRVADPGAVRTAMDSALRAAGMEVPPAAREMAERLGSDTAIAVASRQGWIDFIGIWAGATLPLGATVDTVLQIPVPMFPAEPLDTKYSMSARERVPCVEGTTARDCVLLELRGAPDVTKAILRMMRASMPPDVDPEAAEMAIPSLHLTRTVTYVVEPATLLPHRMVETIEVEAAAAMLDQTIKRTNVVTRTFTYAR